MFSGQLGELRKVDDAQKEQEKWYQNQLDLLEQNRQARSDLNEEWDARELELKRKHQDEMNRLDEARNQLMLSSVVDGLGSMVEMTRTAFGEQSDIYKAAFAVQKAAAIAQSIIAIQQGIAMAAANPFPYNLGAMASVAASTAGIVSNIAAVGMAHDGIDAVPETGTWLLQKGERVPLQRPAQNWMPRWIESLHSQPVVELFILPRSLSPSMVTLPMQRWRWSVKLQMRGQKGDTGRRLTQSQAVRVIYIRL
ncbi:prophage tail length tape measure [Klebsiella pneumoniae]|nr:hypothetical protein [Klebsiella pneumoniae]VED90341.1 prophage tail length tape measure [Klebsiella pneumoniae]